MRVDLKMAEYWNLAILGKMFS